MIGPGKYDDLCTMVRKRAKSDAVLLIVVNGEFGSGFSVQMREDSSLGLRMLPVLLRQMADEIQKDAESHPPQGARTPHQP